MKMTSNCELITENPVILSPLRYPGSKRCLVDYIAEFLRVNELKPELLVEPFAGGASVSLQLLHSGVVEKIGLIDKDPLVASFWKAVFYDTNWLVKQIKNIEVTLEQWQTFKNSVPITTRERALVCLFLNRTSFSGILTAGAGPIGGKNQTSEYGIDCRFTEKTRQTLVHRVRQAAALKEKVAFVWCDDWSRGIKRVREKQDKGQLSQSLLFYFDPPFFEKADQLYNHYFDEKQHIKLRNHIFALREPWLLSYDSVAKVSELYEQSDSEREDHVTHIDLLYTTSGRARRSAREIIISNKRLPEASFEQLPRSAKTKVVKGETTAEEFDFLNPLEVSVNI